MLFYLHQCSTPWPHHSKPQNSLSISFLLQHGMSNRKNTPDTKKSHNQTVRSLTGNHPLRYDSFQDPYRPSHYAHQVKASSNNLYRPNHTAQVYNISEPFRDNNFHPRRWQWQMRNPSMPYQIQPMLHIFQHVYRKLMICIPYLSWGYT